MSKGLRCDYCDRHDSMEFPGSAWFHVERVGLHGQEWLKADFCTLEHLLAFFQDWTPKRNEALDLLTGDRRP